MKPLGIKKRRVRTRYAERLALLAERYRRAEAKIVRGYFSRPHRPKDHVRWLKAQGFKEYSAIKPILAALNSLYGDIDHGIERRDYENLTGKLADETKHARLVMDLLQQIEGKKISSRDLTWLPEDRTLARVRACYSRSFAGLLHGLSRIRAQEIRRRDEALERAAITLTEGGGGALYEVCSKLSQRGVDGKIARAFREILRDEREHKNHGVRSLAVLVTDEASFRRAATIISEISAQRLRMRNEQFGFPLSRAELTALDRRARQSVPHDRS